VASPLFVSAQNRYTVPFFVEIVNFEKEGRYRTFSAKKTTFGFGGKCLILHANYKHDHTWQMQ